MVMVAKKYITWIIIAVMAVAVALCFLAIAFSGRLTETLGGTGVKMEYESKLFDTAEIMTVDIQMDEETWDEMLSNAMSEEYYVCNVVINGKRINNVAIRPKGNTSLSAIAMDDETDRFSLKLEFDHFVEGQTCYGLDKLILNNNYADATNMKEAIIYDMYQYIGANASLYNYAKISVNGEYRGVYLALEGVEQSFLLRNFGTQDGELYKPDSMEMGGGGSSSGSSATSKGSAAPSGFDMSDFAGMTPPSDADGFPFGGSGSGSEGASDDTEQSSESGRPSFGGFPGGDFDFDPSDMPDSGASGFDPENMPDTGSSKPSGKGGFSMGGSGANLNYSDDELDSYSTIWEGEITTTGKSDHRKVVTALKNISEGTDLERYLDVDNVLKYMAVHTFAVNMDSLSGSMAHNYYLYEYDGRLNLFPWDYNLSLGGMSMGSDADATGVVNDAIDTPFAGTKFFDALLSNEEYLERYHSYLQQLADGYVNGGRFDEVYDRIRDQIDSLVETDPTAFYPYDEYETAAGLLYEMIGLRAESIKGQLDGTIPSTDDGQREDSSSLIDASHIDLAAMGKFSMGGSGDFKGRSDRIGSRPSFGKGSARLSGEDGQTGSREDRTQESAEPSSKPSDGSDTGNMPESFDPGNMPEGFSPGSMTGSGSDGESRPDRGVSEPGSAPDTDSPDPDPGETVTERNDSTDTVSESESDAAASGKSDSKGSRQSFFSGVPGQSSGKTALTNGIVYGVCLLVALTAILVIRLVKRRK